MDQAASEDQGVLWHFRERVKTQVWIAVSVYVLVAIVKKRLELPHSLYTILQVFSVILFEKMPVLQAFAGYEEIISEGDNCNQLELFS